MDSRSRSASGRSFAAAAPRLKDCPAESNAQLGGQI
jgi:hypothetical protein